MPLGYAVAVWQSPDATTLCYRWLTVECGSIDLSDYFQEQKLRLSPKEILIILFRTFVVILSQSHLERKRGGSYGDLSRSYHSFLLHQSFRYIIKE